MAIHHYNYGSVQKGDGKGTEAFGECKHPVFRTHDDTNRKAVYVNRLMTVGVEGIPQAEAEQLLNAVFDHAEKKEFVYEHVWRLGDLMLWDNRNSSHARTDFPSTERRLMLRTTVQGRGAAVLGLYAPSLRARSSRLVAATSTGTFGAGFAFARPMLIRARDVAGAQPALRRVREIVAVRGDHHAVAGRKIERLAGREIDARLRLEVAGDLRPEDGVPRQVVAAREIDHQRDVAVRHRRQPELSLERAPCRAARPARRRADARRD